MRTKIKIFMLFLAICVLLFANPSLTHAEVASSSDQIQTAESGSDNETEPSDTDDGGSQESPIQLARISPNDGNEFVQIANFSEDDLHFGSLDLQLFNSANSQVGDFSLPSGMFAKNSSILLSSSITDFAKKLSDKTLPNSAGAAQLFIDGNLASEICWGDSTICENAGDDAASIPRVDSEYGAQILQNILISESPDSGTLSGDPNFIFANLIDPVTLAPIALDSGGFTADQTDPSGGSDPATVNYCNGIELNEVAANSDQQFIELFNPSNKPIDLSGCRLTTNRSDSKYFAFADGATIQSDSFAKVAISDTDLALTKTTSGTVYFLSSDGQTVVDQISYSDLASGTSFAKFADGWKQTYQVTPGTANIFLQYPSCQTGYERNLSSGRCDKITAPATAKICKTGYSLNIATNRCDKEVAAGSSLKACAADQIRNLATNRCDKLASSTAPTPCKTGWERNPETNRCRKIVDNSKVNFPVKSSGKSETEDDLMLTSALIVFGMVMIIIWQFREDLSKVFYDVKVRFFAKKYYNDMRNKLEK